MFPYLNNSLELEKNAIILCDERKILETLSYKEMINIIEVLKTFLTRNVKNENVCLGLLMNHNIYISSIILSLEELKHAFVFLTLENLNKTVIHVNCFWILSGENITEITLFQEVDRVSVCGKNLVLWNRISISTNVSFRDIFCVVQTSGSTGENKFIRVTNTCIQTNVSCLRKIFDIQPADTIFWGTSLTFDPSLVELLLALQSGACLLIVPHKTSINANALYEALFNVAKVTFLQMVPSVFLRWNENQMDQILLHSGLKILALGGEHFPKRILLYERANCLRIFNLYGISEVSCWATVHQITNESQIDGVPIGKCLEGTVVELRDEFGNTVERGTGEIFIGSSSRVCYINDELAENLSGTIFRETGDLAEVNEKGIFLVGRKNRIVKRYGHRINLTKTENKIFQETGLENKCIWLQEHRKILTFILNRNSDVAIKGKILDKIRIKLINILPEESFPDFIDIISNFPLTSHGKVNEKALEKLYIVSKTETNSKDTFKLLWCKYLGISVENVVALKRYKFFEMGGNSISTLQFLSEFKASIGCEYPQELVTKIFDGNYEDCMNCLETFEPLKKKNGETSNEITTKKRKISKNDLSVFWSHNLKACVDSSPLVFEKEETIYIAVGSFSSKFVIFREDGQVVYETTLPNSIESAPSISPCRNFILVGCYDGIMYCVDFARKQIKWEFSTGDKIKSSACFCRTQSAIFGSYDNTVYCVSTKEGSKLWSTLLDGSISSNPISNEQNNHVYLATTKGTCFCLNEDDGRIFWKTSCGGPIFGTACLANSNENIIFPVVQGILHCLQTETGNPLWKYQAGGHIFSSLVPHKSFVLFGCHDKTVNVLSISNSGCTLVKKVMLESETSTTPFVCNVNATTMIISACNSGVISVTGFGTFELLATAPLNGEVFSSPVVCNNRIYVGCRDNKFYCIELNK